MDNEELLNQIGLLLTQLRYARRSLEDIERSTARYTTFAFASALAAGPRFGEPPMFGGALKVYVVNINDLAPGGGLGGFLEGLLGGIGRFFGGLFGGAVGGTISGVALPVLLWKVESIAATVERIVARLGTPKEPVPKGKEAEAGGGGTFFDTLTQITGVVNAFTALFQAASNKPEEAAKTANPLTPEGDRWLAILQTANSLVQGISFVIKGLTLLIPEVIGALAMLIVRLDTIKLAVVELLQFVLREALLLRGVALTVLFDTLSAAARLAANILAILGLTMQSIITSIFSIFGSVFDAALAAIKFISDGLQNTINALLKWLVDSVITVLTVIGDTRIFRVAVHALQVLPYILPSLIQLVRGVSITGTKEEKELDVAKTIPIAGPSLTGATSALLPAFPSVSNTLLDPAAVGTLRGTISTSLAGINTALGDIFGATGKGLTNLSTALDKAASDKTFNDALDQHLGQLRQRSDTLAGALASAQKAAIEHPATGLEAIAGAYEKWLASPGGLKALLDNLTDFFKKTPTSGPGAEQSLAALAIGPTTIDRLRATVEIGDVVIELGPPSESPPPQATLGTPGSIVATNPEEMLQQVLELIHELTERGYTFARGSLLTQF
jgi:hypothetical protein